MTITNVFLNKKRINVCEHIVKMAPHEFRISATRMSARQEDGGSGGDGGKSEWKLSEVNTKDVSRGQDELIGKFKMADCDVISIRGQVMEYTYIPTGIKRELVRFGMNCDQKE